MNSTQAKKSGKFNFLFSLSSHIAYICIAYICKIIVIFIKKEIDLTQMLSSTDYETDVTHVSKNKYVLNHKIKSIPSKLTLIFNKTNKIQVRIIDLFCQHINFLQCFWPGKTFTMQNVISASSAFLKCKL